MADDTIVQKIVVTADTGQAEQQIGSLGDKFEAWAKSHAGMTEQGVAGWKALGDVIGGVGPKLLQLGTVVAAVGAAIGAMAIKASATGVELGKLQNATGATTAELSTLVLTFASFGVSSATAAAAIENFSHKVSEAARTAAIDMQASADKITAAQTKINDIAASEGNLAIRQLELNYARRKALYGQDMDAYEKQELERRKLDQQQADLDAQRLKLAREREKAEEEERVARANDIGALRQQLGGVGSIVLDARTKIQSFATAVAQSIAGAKDRVAAFAEIWDRITDPAVKADLAKALGMDKLIPALKEGETWAGLLAEREKQLQQSGLKLTESQQNNLIDLSRAWDRLTTDIGAAITKIAAVVAPVITAVLNFVAQEIENIGRDLKLLATELQHSWEGLKLIWGLIQSVAEQAATAVVTAWTVVRDFFARLWKDYIADPAKQAWDLVTGYFEIAADKVLGIWRPVAKFFSDLWVLIKRIIGAGPGAATAGGGQPDAPSAGGIPMARGGYVSGPGTTTSDSIFARLSRGEFVINARAVEHWGTGLFASLNALNAPRFASGGMVPRLAAIPAFAGGGMVGGGRTFTINFGGESFGGLGGPDVTLERLERAAVRQQLSSAGRKPSWRK